MAKKKDLDENLQELKIALQSKDAIVGKEEVIKALKNTKLSKVFMASNTALDMKNDLEHYCKLSGAELVALNQDNEEIGILAKKSYFISVVGVKK